MNDEQFLSYLVGFIDGNSGVYHSSLGKNVITIKLRGLWLPNIAYMWERLSRITGPSRGAPRLTKDAHAVVAWGRQLVLATLKRHAIVHGLPVLERKWGNLTDEIEAPIKHKRLSTLNQVAPRMSRAEYLVRTCHGPADSLLADTNEAFYWNGFLVADGHFHIPKGKTTPSGIVVALSNKDKQHLEKLAVFTGVKNIRDDVFVAPNGQPYTKSVLQICGSSDVRELARKFDIRPRKTYNPPAPDLDWMGDGQFLSFLVGFIDGDGSIDARDGHTRIRIAVHASWLSNLEYMDRRLKLLAGLHDARPHIMKDGTASICWGSRNATRMLKEHILAANLPALERKWGNVSLEPTYYEKRRAVSAKAA